MNVPNIESVVILNIVRDPDGMDTMFISSTSQPSLHKYLKNKAGVWELFDQFSTPTPSGLCGLTGIHPHSLVPEFGGGFLGMLRSGFSAGGRRPIARFTHYS